jgi:hypothetical protein
MSQLVVPIDVLIQGGLAAQSIALPSASVGDTQVVAAAKVQASKLQQQFQPQIADNYATTTASFRRVIHRVRGATGTLQAFRAGNTTICVGAATISIQLKKNGANILSSALVLDSTNTNYVAEAAAGFTSASVVTGDLLEIDVTATAGGGTLGSGFFAALEIREDPD